MGGNPINTIDPLGLYWEMVDGEPSLLLGDPPSITLTEQARNNGQITDEQAQLAHEGYDNIPRPSAQSPFVQKLQAVFNEAAFQLAEDPAYNGNAGLIAFAQLLQQDAPMIAGMMAAFAAIQFLPPPWNVGIDSLLIATGMTMVGIDGVQLIAYLLRMASEIDDTDICDGARLQELGEGLAEELFNRGLEVAEGALLGGLGAMGSMSRAFRNLNNRPLNGESHEEMTDEVVRRMERDIRDDPDRIVADDLLDQADLDRLTRIREDLGITSNNQLRRNVAIGEGHVDGVDIGEIIGVSGRRGPGVEMPENRIFTTTVDGHPRDFDSEVFVLENIAQRLTPRSRGTIILLSERTVCNSCQGVITQFREMFPNINLVVRAGSQ